MKLQKHMLPILGLLVLDKFSYIDSLQEKE